MHLNIYIKTNISYLPIYKHISMLLSKGPHSKRTPARSHMFLASYPPAMTYVTLSLPDINMLSICKYGTHL